MTETSLLSRGTLASSGPPANTIDTTQWRTRTFTYDSLSQLLTAINPESGINPQTGKSITWTYDSDSNVLTKTDARNITITYNYDQLHRVATTGTTHAKSYSNGDPVVDYFFDQTSYNGLTIAEGVNHRTGMADMTGSAAWTFDTEGRTLSEKRTVNITGLTPSAVTKTLTYAYNPDGSLKSLTYPSGHKVVYYYMVSGQTTTAGRARSAFDSTGTVINYVTNATYAPHGDVAGYTNGSATGFTGIVTTNAWNNRFQPSSFTAATTGTGAHTIQSLTFNFNEGTPTAPIDNGLLMKITNGVSSGRTTNYTYDQLNRIVAGWHDATDWGTQYTLDIWGNLTQKAPCNNTVGCPSRTTGESLSVSVTASKNNRFDTYNYDASGNMLDDKQGHTFAYDAENRPKTGGGVTYYYDGEGERVAKSSGKLYLFGTNSAPVVETDTAGTMTAEYVFFNGKRVGMRKADGSVHYYFADQIGSANVVTNATGVMPPEQDIEYHPYGEEQVYADTLGQQYKFTGHEHDTETNDEYFGARYYSSSFGRFLTPDWAATPVPIPYAKQGIPQTLNLYSYVENNPITGTDPDGHEGPGSYEQAMQWANEVGQRAADDLNKIPLPSDRGSQGIKGSGQLLLGAATIASIATGEPGPLLAVTGILTGSSLAVRGTTNIVGAATNTNVSEADKVLAATANPAGLITTAATGGNLTAGRVAATAQSVVMSVDGAIKNPQSLSSPATVAKNTNLAVNIGQLGSQLSGSTANLIKPPAPPPPPPKPPSPPACALSKDGCH